MTRILRWATGITGFGLVALAWAGVEFQAAPMEDAFTLLALGVFDLGLCAIVLRD